MELDEHQNFKEEYKRHQSMFGQLKMARNEVEQCCAFDIILNQRCPRRVLDHYNYCPMHLDICLNGQSEYFTSYLTKQHKYDTQMTDRWRRIVVDHYKDNITERDMKGLYHLLINNFNELEILYIYYQNVYDGNYRTKKDHYCYNGAFCYGQSHKFETKIRRISGDLIYSYFKPTKYHNIDDQERAIKILLAEQPYLIEQKNNLSFNDYILFLENIYINSSGIAKDVYYDLLKIMIGTSSEELDL